MIFEKSFQGGDLGENNNNNKPRYYGGKEGHYVSQWKL
jgi:hypothetical protein